MKQIFYNYIVKKLGYENIGEISKPKTLIELLQYAYEHVPYYRDLFKGVGLVENNVVSLLRFQELPLLNKKILQREGDRIISNSVNRKHTYWNTSGGSTGEPARILQDKTYLKYSRAITYEQKKWTGYQLGDPMIKIWGDEREIIKGSQSLKSRVSNKIKNLTFLNSFSMSTEDMDNYIEAINRIKPKLIVAYAQSMYELCNYAELTGRRLDGIGAIMTSAGTLYPFMRETIERVSQCKVVNRYGSREVGNIACECLEQNGLHIAEEGVYVEVLDESGNPCPAGMEGEIVVTSLINLAMPLIRYQIGDRGILSNRPCACGRKGPILQQVTGRTVDLFKTRNGKIIDGEYFTHLIYFKKWVSKFQFIQKDYERIQVKIVRQGVVPEEDVQQIVNQVKTVMGQECHVEIQLVDEILPSKSGKYRYTISEVI